MPGRSSSAVTANGANAKKTKKEAHNPPPESKKTSAAHAKKKPDSARASGTNLKKMTLKDAIAHFLGTQTDVVGLATIKKAMSDTYGFAAGSAFNKRLAKTLTEMVDSETIGKNRGSYHAGKDSVAGINIALREEKRAEAERREAAGDIKCPFCERWCSGLTCFVGEDSIARGGEYRCEHAGCRKTLWTWISDGYTIGRPVEYKVAYKGLYKN
uniref:Uncharacterized protein n=1 Tax=Chromera velia CCMP2878 TaxID=1169474 RepID=A0A0G4F930_9ALVE|eukprot:Cvel_15711.t1-p1 / transcript=Cvel_15711.t1 / gene=Cvel_15711 / organism=Chromera_velia_CCMP2878 / gene_product=hypothetical protein / transcript_product=hypothetical protein / location=Cvel_scaffold1174:11350-11985(+) / protein_length=212 / sequence_SO=supercontig / SO=protein_coding / is_pseudo=false